MPFDEPSSMHLPATCATSAIDSSRLGSFSEGNSLSLAAAMRISGTRLWTKGTMWQISVAELTPSGFQ
jgi:hypothetical protein